MGVRMATDTAVPSIFSRPSKPLDVASISAMLLLPPASIALTKGGGPPPEPADAIIFFMTQEISLPLRPPDLPGVVAVAMVCSIRIEAG